MGAAGCLRQPSQLEPSGRLVVAVGLAPYAWLVEQIGREHVEVLTLVHPGQSPELFQPTDAEVSRLISAAVYFQCGMPFERGPWFAAIRSHARTRLVDLLAAVPLRSMEAHAHGQQAGSSHRVSGRGGATPEQQPGPAAGKDPHVWLSPRLLKILARTVAQTLQGLDPQRAPEYQDNLGDLEARLDAADREIRQTLSPIRGNPFFVVHPAWGYFAEEYGLRQVAIQAEGKDPTDQELTQLQQLARAQRAKVIFVQPQFASRAAEALARAIGARTETLDDLAPDVIEGLRETAAKLARAYD